MGVTSKSSIFDWDFFKPIQLLGIPHDELETPFGSENDRPSNSSNSHCFSWHLRAHLISAARRWRLARIISVV